MRSNARPTLVVVRSVAKRMRERSANASHAASVRLLRECCYRFGTPLELAARRQRMQPVMRREVARLKGRNRTSAHQCMVITPHTELAAHVQRACCQGRLQQTPLGGPRTAGFGLHDVVARAGVGVVAAAFGVVAPPCLGLDKAEEDDTPRGDRTPSSPSKSMVVGARG